MNQRSVISRVSFRTVRLACGVGVLSYFALVTTGLLGPDGRQLISNGATIITPGFAAVATGIAARATWGRQRRAWWWVCGSAASWGLGQLVWTISEQGLHREVPFPSLADAGYLGAVPLAAIGIATFFETPTGRLARIRLGVEAVMVALSVLLVSWAVILGPLVRAGAESRLEYLIGLAYPVGDVLVMTIVVVVAAHSRQGTRQSLRWVAIGFAALVYADTGFAVLNFRGTYASGAASDLGWVVGYLCIGLAALDSGPVESTRIRGDGWLVRVRELAPFVVLAIGGMVVLFHLFHDPEDVLAWWGAVGLLALVTVAVVIASIENGQLTDYLEDRVEARTRELASRERFYRSLIRHSSEVVTVVAEDHTVIHQTSAAGRVFGAEADATMGVDLLDLFDTTQRVVISAALDRARDQPGVAHETEVRLAHRDGRRRRLEMTVTSLLHDPSVHGIVVNTRDVTERRDLEDQLSHQAFHDALTELPNRTLFRDRLTHAVARAAWTAAPVAVLVIDLDGFKSVNDGLGHSAGDELLRAFAVRIGGLLRPTDTFARLGGDEFAILAEDDGADGYAVAVADRILTALLGPFEVQGRSILVGASIGIATGRTSHGVEELLRDADVALYRAKAAGKSRYDTFVPEMHSAALERLDLQASLRTAVERAEFFLEYQPLLDLETQRLHSVEALIRWHHPTRGLTEPSEFIDLAEETGLIQPIGRWVLDQACRQGAEWIRRFGGGAPTVAVNVSGRQLNQPDFVDDLASILVASGLPSRHLVIELTESLLIDTDGARDRLGELKELGVRIAIDDFGTGYSALSYLHDLPIDILKIDRSFVAAMATGEGKQALLRSIIDIGRTLELETVAEGIETADELAQLRAMGCPFGQGFHLARPGPAEAISYRLRRRGVPAT